MLDTSLSQAVYAKNKIITSKVREKQDNHMQGTVEIRSSQPGYARNKIITNRVC